MLKKIDVSLFDNAFAVLSEAFPLDELRPYEEQKALLSDPKYALYSLSDGGVIAAVAAIWEFDDYLFLEHLATKKAFRNKSLGKQVITELQENFDKKIVLEVEPELDALKARRINFYKRLGFKLNEYPYLQPPISKGRNFVTLKIMSLDAPLSFAEFNSIKAEIYQYVYSYKERPS